MLQDKELKVYDVLNELGIGYIRYEHPAVYTVEEANNLGIDFKGQQCKNLFLRNRRGDAHYLVILDDRKQADLKKLAGLIGSTALSFASEERLEKYLGLTRGSVTPFGLINDTGKKVEVLVDKSLKEGSHICFHPNVNTATLTIGVEDFMSFLEWCGNKVTYISL